MELEEKRKDGKIIVTNKGTLSLLDEWLKLKLRPTTNGAIAEIDTILSGLKRVRKLRQKPAHKIDEDIFKQEFFHQQQSLMIDIYESITLLRRVFQLHPSCREHEIPNWLETGIIYTE